MVGIAFRGVEQLPETQRPPKALLMQWYMATERIKAMNANLDRKALAVANKFLDDGFPGVILKGQGIAQLYLINENADAKGASVATAARSISAACDEGRFIFPEECASAPLGLSSPRSMLKHSCKSLRPCTSGVLVLSPTDSHESAQISQVALPLLASGVSAEGSQLTAHSSKQTLSPYRTPGDIDIWLMGEREEILGYVRRHVPNCKPVYHHVDFPVVKDVDIEVHFTPTWMNSPVTNRRLQKFFREQSSFSFSSSSKALPTPDLAFNRVYILVHIYRHLFAEGIGLRQLLDYYFVLCQGFTEEEREETMRALRALKMQRFATAVMWVLQQVFGMDSRYLLTAPNEQEGRFLLSEIMLAGNFGQYDERLQHVKGESRLHWGLRKVVRNFRFVRSYPSEVLWSPLFKLWQFFFFKG